MVDKIATVRDVMTKEVITLKKGDSLELASQLFEKYNFDGFPIVNEDNELVGLITAYDMILESSKMHLPVVFNLLKQIGSKELDEKALGEHFSKLREIKLESIMNIDPLIVRDDVNVEELAKEFVEHHRVNPIPVVSSDKKLVGVVSRYDVIRFFNQQYLHLVIESADHGGILRRLTRLDES